MDKSKKSKVKIGFSILIVLFFSGSYFYQQGVKRIELQIKIEKYRNLVISYEDHGKSCLNLNGMSQPNYANNPRSTERINSVWSHYLEIMRAKCFIDKRGTIFLNPYKGIENVDFLKSPPGSVAREILQGFYFDVDMGMPFLRTGGSICADGSYSPSVGRGTCSWHGGYGSQQGVRFEFKSAKPIYDPRKMLKFLKQ